MVGSFLLSLLRLMKVDVNYVVVIESKRLG